MLHLASRSPRRAELLGRLGLEFGTIDLDLPERQGADEPAAHYVRRVAREKAGAGLLHVMAVPGALVLGADTEVILDGAVFGKPVDAADAGSMLRKLAGRTHEVITAVAVVSAGSEVQAVSTSLVTFGEMSESAIEAYLAAGEWDGKAGAYAIQGRAQAYIAHLAGSYSGVMGLPLHETARLLREFGIDCPRVPVAPPAVALG